MAIVSLTTIKNWFKTGLKPTQSQFWDVWDSFRHKSESVPYESIEGLDAVLLAQDVKINAIALPDDVIKDGEVYVSGTNVDILANDFIWRLLQVEYTNTALYHTVLPFSASGYTRTDIFVGTNLGTIYRVAGEQRVGVAFKPSVPPGTIEIASVDVDDAVVGTPVIPKPKQPVTSVNGMRGDVVLNIINDLVTGGIYNFLSAEQGKVLKTQIDGINTLLTSNDVNLDTVQEVVDAIKTVQTSLSTILVNDLTTGGTTKALTAEMGKTLKGLIDTLTTAVNGKEPAIIGGAVGQYYSYNKTWQTIPVVDISGKQDTANQVEVNTAQDAQASWHGKTVFFTANVTITIPAAGLPSGYTFEGVTTPSCTVTWAITSPKVWALGAPAATPGKSIFTLMQLMSNSNNIYLFGL